MPLEFEMSSNAKNHHKNGKLNETIKKLKEILARYYPQMLVFPTTQMVLAWCHDGKAILATKGSYSPHFVIQ